MTDWLTSRHNLYTWKCQYTYYTHSQEIAFITYIWNTSPSSWVGPAHGVRFPKAKTRASPPCSFVNDIHDLVNVSNSTPHTTPKSLSIKCPLHIERLHSSSTSISYIGYNCRLKLIRAPLQSAHDVLVLNYSLRIYGNSALHGFPR